VMMISSMIKFPLVFISGIFIPIEDLPFWGRLLSAISPLTYFTDLASYSMQGRSYYPIALNFAVLIVFSVVFLVLAIKIHEQTMPKRL
jgi:ABC-2 type transport system permease protein